MNVPPQFKQYVESEYTNPGIGDARIELEPPPRDDSHSTRMELEEIQSAIHEGKLPKSILNVANLDPLQLFYSLAKKKGIDPLEEDAKRIAEDLTKLSFELKFKFKRRRPYEVKKEHDVEFAHHKTDTSESPSYPSGHAMLGYGVAEFYKSNYPEMADEWDNIADIIAHSRVQMGVHYPSDVKASKEVIRQVLADGVKLAEWEKWASAARFARRAIRQAGGKVNLSAPRGARPAKGTRGTFKRVAKPVSTPPKTMVPGAPSASSTQGWWDKTKGFATKNPYQAAGIGAGVGGVGIYGATQLSRPPQIKAASLQSALLEGSLSLEKLLSKAKLTPLAESLGNLRTRKVLENAIMDNIELANRTGRFGQMPRIPIPKKFLSPKDLYRAGFVDSYVAVPELGQTSWRTFRHPLHNLHLHEHGDLLNMHVDSLPSMAMTSVKNSLSRKDLRRLIDLAPSGVPLNRLPRHGRTRSFKNKISDTLSGLGHVVTEGVPGFINYGVKSLNPFREMGMAEEILSKIPKNYLADEYGYSRVKTSAEKLRLYHGSPENLEALEPRQPNKGRWGEPGIYTSKDEIVAALYAIARNNSKGRWGILPDGRLIAKSERELNPEGYVYEFESDKYIPPPADDPGIGYAVTETPTLLGKKKVKAEDLLDRVIREDDRDKFLEYFKKTSSQRLRTTIFGVDPKGNLLHGFSGQGFYKFPGGGVDPGESIVDAAKRELLEEAGYEVESIEELQGLDTSDAVASNSAKGHMGHGSSLTKYLLARLGNRNESMLGIEGDAINNLRTAPIREVLEGLEGDMLFGSSVAESNHAALSRLRDVLEKTSSEQPLLRHRATLLIRDPDTGKLLVADNTGDPRFTDISPFSFPGGGIYHDEYHTPRTPTEEDIIEGARREALEELGIGLANPRVVGSSEVLLPEYKQKAIKHRKAPYEGKHEHYVLADKGPADNSLYNSEGDAFTRGQYVDPKTIYESLIQFSKGLNSHAPLNAGQAKAIKEHLLSKQSSLEAQFLPEYLELVEKTSAYKDYRPRGTLYLLDGKGGVMADKPTESYGSIAPFHFPGGGIFEQEKVDRLPTSAEIAEGIEREALEELGTKLKNVRILQDNPVNIDMPDWWRERQKQKRGLDYKGIAEFYAAAERGDIDKSIYGADNDEFKGTFYPIDEVASAIEASTKPGDEHYDLSMGQARLLRSLLEKTSSEQPLLRHRSTLLIRDPETGKLLAAKEPATSKASPFFFPGGGLYDDEYDTPRNPTEEEIIEGARREALEELGIHLENPRVVGSIGQELEDWWKAKVLKNRGVPYVGGHEHYVLADKGKEDRSLYNVEGDAFEQGDYYDPAEIVEALSRAAKSDSVFAPFNREQVRAIRENLLSKKASVTGTKDSPTRILRNKSAGLESQESIYARLAPLLPEGVHHVSGGLPDARGISDVDIFYPTDEHSDLLSKMPKGTFVVKSKPDKTIYSIPGYDREVNLFATLDPMKQESILHRATMMELAAKYPELERMAYKLKASGLGSEPAWAKVLGVKGDPYERMQHTQEMLEAAEKLSLKKNASDLSVLTAVPKQNLDLIMRKGLASQKAISEDPELTKAFLDQRGYKEEEWRKELSDALKGFKPDSRLGASVFFSEPDPDKVSDPRHFINQFDTTKLRVNLGKLLKDIPETRFHGVELEPFNEEAWEADPDNYPSRRHRDLTTDEIAALIAKDPKELWKHYKDEYIGKLYAGDVPHGMIVTPSGIIPPEYLEQVEKTSSAKEQLKHILVTGHSGAGKTTYARQLAQELGMPLHELDSRAKEILSQDYPDHEDIGWPGDVSERVVREALALDTPHVIEGTQIHDVPDLGADLRRILVDTPEDRVVEQRAAREYEKRKLNNKPYRPMEGHRDAARKLVDYYRDSIDNFRSQPGVESIVPEVKQAALEDEFQPDLTPDDLKALGVYDQVYGDAPSEASMKEWPEHWINKQDPLGWLQWYGRYSGGRRTEDDARQIKRWKSFKARHLAQYLKKPTPRRAAALRNWGIDVENY